MTKKEIIEKIRLVEVCQINDWYAVCDQLNIPYNALLIELNCSKVTYDDMTETNILTYLN